MAKTKEVKPALKITVKNGTVKIEILNADRLTQHGFGLFLQDAKPGEIQTDDASLKQILQQSYRSGLRPCEIFQGNIIGFCDQEFPLKELSLHGGASEWFRECAKV